MVSRQQVQALVGKKVELICFALFSVYVHLEGSILLTIEAEFTHALGDTQRQAVFSFPIAESNLISILECSVVDASVNSSGDLRLSFSNGDSLIVTKKPEFESYRLKIGGEEFFA